MSQCGKHEKAATWDLFYSNTYQFQEALPPIISTFQVKISKYEFGRDTDVPSTAIIQNQNSSICLQDFLKIMSLPSLGPHANSVFSYPYVFKKVKKISATLEFANK